MPQETKFEENPSLFYEGK